jgi:hypothetical protein
MYTYLYMRNYAQYMYCTQNYFLKLSNLRENACSVCTECIETCKQFYLHAIPDAPSGGGILVILCMCI